MIIPEPYKLAEYEIILSWDCNQACCYCFNNKSSVVQEVKTFTPEILDQSVAFIRDTASEDTIHLQFFGGEPMLFMDVIETFIRKVREACPAKKLSLTMTTNFTAATRQAIDFLQQNNFALLVSLDGPAMVHELNRGIGTFAVVMDNLAYALSKNMFISARATVCANTLKYFEQSWEFLNKLGIPFKWLLNNDDEYPTEDLYGLTDTLRHLYERYRNNNDLVLSEYADRINSARYCINPYRTISIRYDGSLVICSRANWVIGSVAEGITQYERIKDLPFYTQTKHPDCLDCPAEPWCHGGCFACHVEKTPEITVQYHIDRGFCLMQLLMQVFVLKCR